MLVASLPSTPETEWLLTPELMGLLPDGSIFVNVGRGDLVKSGMSTHYLSASLYLFMYMRESFPASGLVAVAIAPTAKRDITDAVDTILSALNAPGGLSGVLLDVTDPEPLTSGHALWTHPSAIVTPHTSGSFEQYYEAGADILIAQKKRIEAGEKLLNIVDPAKGY